MVHDNVLFTSEAEKLIDSNTKQLMCSRCVHYTSTFDLSTFQLME